MNKKVWVGAALGIVAVAAVAASYFILRGSQQRLLQYVPADTVLFAGSAKPIDLHKYLESSQWALDFIKVSQPDLDKLEETAKSKGPLPHFLIVLYRDYLEQFRQGPDQVLAHYGLGDKTETALYLVGAVPVARWTLREPAAFLKTIEAAEQKSGLAPKLEKVGDVDVRRYSVAAHADKPSFDLIIATGNRMATITIDSSKFDDSTRQLVLGSQKPATSLAGGKLQKLAKAHGLDEESIYYIDFVEISKSLVDPKTTLLGQHLQLIFGDMPSLASIQTPACQKEIPAFVSNVPRLVGGLKTYKTSASGIDMSVVYDLEIANAALLKSLSDLRGVLPKHLLTPANSPLVWFGLGLDTDKIGPTITNLVRDFGAQTYQCEPLLKAQKSVTSQNLAGLMFIGLARGVKGVSAAFYNLNIANLKSASTDGLDGIVTVSAPDPLVLWDMAAKFLPPVTIPKNGDAVDVPLPMPPGASVKVALKGNHLVAYIGEKSTQVAQQLKAQDLTPNGMITFGYDYSLLGEFAGVATKNTEKAADAEKMFKNLAGFKFGIATDFTDAGWRSEIAMHIPKTKPVPTM